jgi:DNA primase
MAFYEESASVFCFACGRRGTAVDFVMQTLTLPFCEARNRLIEDGFGRIGATATTARTTPNAFHKTATTNDGEPARRGTTTDEASALWAVRQGIKGLHWNTRNAEEARRHLRDFRGLTHATIESAMIGFWGERVRRLPGHPAGLLIPWYDGEKLVKLIVRQRDDLKPKYRIAYTNHPICYPGLFAIRPGMPLVVAEGELDALLLGQELEGLASVITLGSASMRPSAVTEAARSASRVYVAHDADQAGDCAAAKWSGAIRVRPPMGKDWGGARLAGLDLRGFWKNEI